MSNKQLPTFLGTTVTTVIPMDSPLTEEISMVATVIKAFLDTLAYASILAEENEKEADEHIYDFSGATVMRVAASICINLPVPAQHAFLEAVGLSEERVDELLPALRQSEKIAKKS